MRSTYSPSRRQFLKSASLFAATTIITGRESARAAESDLIVRTADPYNAEPPLSALITDPITPVKHFYIRNHGPQPQIESASLKLHVEGMVQRPLTLSLAEIQQRYRQQSIEATLVCGGNRRQEISAIRPVGGVPWEAGAIGNARWNGAALAEILRAAEVRTEARHVWFEGLDAIKDKDGGLAPFGGSIPIEKALAEDAPVLLAHAMNGQPLTTEHGFPLRAIVPGHLGARSVKWLTKITLSDQPSPNYHQAIAYRVVQTDSNEEAAASPPIKGFPLNAAICVPASGARLRAGRTSIAGYALAPGEPRLAIDKVEVSHDGGQTWLAATLTSESRPYVWRLWTAQLDLPAGKQELVVRATDSRGNTMPQRGEWNFKGYLYNGWHRVAIEVS